MISKLACNIISDNAKRIEKKAEIVKNANFILGHLLQNMFGRASMSYPKALGTEKMFLRNMAKPDEGMSTLPGNALYGFGKGLVPELGIMNEQFAHLGKSLRNTLAEKGMSMNDLSNRDIVVLRRALGGDFVKALESNSPLANELVGSVVASYNPQLKALFDKGILTPNMIRRKAARQAKSMGKDGLNDLRNHLPIDESQLPMTPEQAQKLLEGFGKTWKENRLTSNLADAINTRATEKIFGDSKFSKLLPEKIRNKHRKGLAQKLREAAQGDDTMLRKSLRRAGDVAGNAALAAVDLPTLGFNAVKRVADSPIFGKIKPGKVVQENLQDLFVTQPVQESFAKGMKGNYTQPLRFGHIKQDIAKAKQGDGIANLVKNYATETVDSQVFNPFTAATKQIANGFGKAVHDAGITPAQLAEFAAKNGEKIPVLKQFPAEPKPLSKFLNYGQQEAGNAASALRDGISSIPSILSGLKFW